MRLWRVLPAASSRAAKLLFTKSSIWGAKTIAIGFVEAIGRVERDPEMSFDSWRASGVKIRKLVIHKSVGSVVQHRLAATYRRQVILGRDQATMQRVEAMAASQLLPWAEGDTV